MITTGLDFLYQHPVGIISVVTIWLAPFKKQRLRCKESLGLGGTFFACHRRDPAYNSSLTKESSLTGCAPTSY